MFLAEIMVNAAYRKRGIYYHPPSHRISRPSVIPALIYQTLASIVYSTQDNLRRSRAEGAKKSKFPQDEWRAGCSAVTLESRTTSVFARMLTEKFSFFGNRSGDAVASDWELPSTRIWNCFSNPGRAKRRNAKSNLIPVKEDSDPAQPKLDLVFGRSANESSLSNGKQFKTIQHFEPQSQPVAQSKPQPQSEPKSQQ